MIRSSNRWFWITAPAFSAAPSPHLTRSNSENSFVPIYTPRPTLQPISRSRGAANGVPRTTSTGPMTDS